MRIWQRENGAEPSRARRIRRARIRTAEWLALKRGRVGCIQGNRISHIRKRSGRQGVVCVLAGNGE